MTTAAAVPRTGVRMSHATARSRRCLLCSLAVVVAMTAAVPAHAKVRASRDADAVANAFMRHKDLQKEGTQSDFVVLPPEGRPAGYSDKPLAKFPRRGSHFSILSTGNTLFAPMRNMSEATSFNNHGPHLRGARDLVMLRVKFKVPQGRNCLYFNFKFLSEEFPEFVDEDYNDAFIAEIDRSNWDSPRADPTIDWTPANFAEDNEGNPISINAVGDAAVAPRFAAGTTYDAATQTLRASTRITPGDHTLFLSLFDQGDRQYDSTVFFDGLRFATRSNCRSGVIVAQ